MCTTVYRAVHRAVYGCGTSPATGLRPGGHMNKTGEPRPRPCSSPANRPPMHHSALILSGTDSPIMQRSSGVPEHPGPVCTQGDVVRGRGWSPPCVLMSCLCNWGTPPSGWEPGFPDTGGIAHTAEKTAIQPGPFHQPAIRAFRTDRIAGTAATLCLGRRIRAAWHSGPAGRASGQQVTAMPDMLAAIPDAAVIPFDAQHSPATRAANMDIRFRTGRWNNSVGRIRIHDAPFPGVPERLLFG